MGLGYGPAAYRLTAYGPPGRPAPRRGADTQGMDTDLQELLKSLRVWDPEVTTLPGLDPAAAPDAPLPLFAEWLRRGRRGR